MWFDLDAELGLSARTPLPHYAMARLEEFTSPSRLELRRVASQALERWLTASRPWQPPMSVARAVEFTQVG
jgi:hypothetical protein